MLSVFNLILLPQFEMMYSSLRSTASPLTEQILVAIKLLPYFIYIIFLIVITGFSLYIFYFRKLPPTQQVKIMIRIPLMKTFLYFKSFALFFRSIKWFITRWIVGTRSINNNDEAKVSSILSV